MEEDHAVVGEEGYGAGTRTGHGIAGTDVSNAHAIGRGHSAIEEGIPEGSPPLCLCLPVVARIDW